MNIHHIEPTEIAIRDGKGWRTLGTPKSFAVALAWLETLKETGRANKTARIGVRVFRDDKRLRPENTVFEYHETGTVAALINKANHGTRLESLRVA